MQAWLFSIVLLYSVTAHAVDPLPSWNEGASKQAIINFIRATTEKNSPQYVPEDERIAAFDQDGTLWVEQPIYTQVRFCLDRVHELAAQNPALKDEEPFKTVLSGNVQALRSQDLEAILKLTLGDITVEQFQQYVAAWLKKAEHARWHKPYTDLTYLPMQEVLRYFRASGYKTYIVTGGGQDFVRVYSKPIYDIPSEQVVGSMEAIHYSLKNGIPTLMREPKVLLNDNFAGKPEGIQLMIGKRPYAAFGNSIGDEEMLEYTKAGPGLRLCMLVLHDDAEREYAYGPAQNLPDSKVGTFTQSLYDKAQKSGWVIISMKNDWNRVFAF